MAVGEGTDHELGWLRATLESMGQQLDRHIHLEADRARDTASTLREILEQTRETNGRVTALEKWRAVAEPQLAKARKTELDGAAVRTWWKTKRGQVTLVAGGATFVASGAVQLAAAIKALGW